MIIADKLNLTLGGKTLLSNISFNFDQDQRIALVGRNGSGKTTLLKVISDKQAIDSGMITVEKNRKIAYLPQEVVLFSKKTILEEALLVLGDVVSLQDELKELEQRFEQSDSADINHDDLEHYAYLQEKVSSVDIDGFEVETRKILKGLGFTQEQLGKPVDTFSVGWKMRLVLAKLLLQKADFYLFDEPTNHLDIFAKDWFVEFLKNTNFGFLLVSHDRFLLDHVCERTFELHLGNGRLYHGNYTKFLKLKKKESVELESAYVAQQKEIKRKRATIDRFRAKSSKAKMAKSMEKSLDKIEIIEMEHEQKSINLRFPDVERAGKIVLKVNELSKTFGDQQIFKNASFDLNRGEKAAILASNGKGKTTLLNLIVGKYPLEEGTFSLGHNVSWAMFEQDQARVLNPKNDILQEVENACQSAEARKQVRSLLGSFLFPGDDVYKKIGVLSGGERNRVAMVKVLLQKANLLFLDEPTNHLDIQSKEILLQALKQFPGTILFVSHDRDFLDALATRIFELTPQGVVSYEGNYESFLYQKRQKLESTKSVKLSDRAVASRSIRKIGGQVSKKARERQKEMKKLENKIEKLERERKKLLQEFDGLKYGSDIFHAKSNRLEEVSKLTKEAYDLWENLQK